MSEVEIGSSRFSVTEDANAGFWATLGSGKWERATFEAISSQLTPETTVLDFGAWIGPITLYAATRAARVHSFEPDPVAAATLRANIAANPTLAEKITVHEKAVWSEPGTLRLGAKTAQGDSMSSVHHTGSAVSWEVPAITPAEIGGLVQGDGPVFVKVDIEGAEYAVVPMLADILARPGTSALVSFHPRFAAGGHPRWHKTIPMTWKIFRMFRGFKVYRVHRASFRRAPLIELLTRLGIPCFETRISYLFVK